MHTEHFNQSLILAARLVDGGDYDDALTVLRPLLECELHDVHKSIVCVNMAIVHGTKGETADALACYERGVGFERRHGRFFVAEQKAAYMAEQGWTSDSLTLYERLLSEPSLTDEDAERLRHNINVLKERLG
jgi:predicted negative regulator of RcsB-dependent stress response